MFTFFNMALRHTPLIHTRRLFYHVFISMNKYIYTLYLQALLQSSNPYQSLVGCHTKPQHTQSPVSIAGADNQLYWTNKVKAQSFIMQFIKDFKIRAKFN